MKSEGKTRREYLSILFTSRTRGRRCRISRALALKFAAIRARRVAPGPEPPPPRPRWAAGPARLAAVPARRCAGPARCRRPLSGFRKWHVAALGSTGVIRITGHDSGSAAESCERSAPEVPPETVAGSGCGEGGGESESWELRWLLTNVLLLRPR